MAIKNELKNTGILFLLGAALLALGLGVSYVRLQMDPATVAAGLLGAASLLICAWRVRRMRPRGAAVGIGRRVVFVICIVVWTALFIEANYFASRLSGRWDLTVAKQHTLSKQTKDILETLDQDIRVTAFFVGIPPKYLEDLLREYERLAKGRIKTEIIDPIVQIGYAAQFGNVISGKEKKIFVRSQNEQQEVDFTGDALSEQMLTNAVIRVTRRMRHVYFLTGHNEYNIYDNEDAGLKAFDAMLQSNHIMTTRLMLGVSGKIPDDCDVLVLAGPRSHIRPDEESMIQEYLRGGGDALILIEHSLVTTPEKPLTPEEMDLNPSLNSILSEWGLRVASDVVVDLASHASGDVGSPATRNYLSHRSIVNGLDYTFFIRPRSIAMLPSRRPSVKVAPIILTASDENSWGESNRTLQVKFDPELDRPGPVPIAFAVWEPKEEGDRSDTRLIVITDADFLTNVFIGQYSNARLGLNAVNWLSEADYQVFMDPKDIDVQRLDLTSQQKRVVAVILVLIPFVIAVFGVMVWMNDRMS